MLIDTVRPEAEMSQVREEPPETEQTQPKSRSRLNFLSGLFAGAAISSLVPWSALNDVTPSGRLGILALLCAAFVSFRLLTSNRLVKEIMALVFVAGGGFLMSAGPHFAAMELHLPLVFVGAMSFLCGITLLLRERSVAMRVDREQSIKRFGEAADRSAIRRREVTDWLESPVLFSDNDVTLGSDRSEDELRQTVNISALARAVGIKERFHPPSGSGETVLADVEVVDLTPNSRQLAGRNT